MDSPRWTIAQARGRCAECTERIAIGDHIALWTEVIWQGYCHFRIRRRYCAPCGELLLDSLTTISDVTEAA